MLNSLDDKELGTCGLYRQRPIIKTVRSTGFLTLKERSDTVIKVKGTNVLALKRLALSDSLPSARPDVSLSGRAEGRLATAEFRLNQPHLTISLFSFFAMLILLASSTKLKRNLQPNINGIIPTPF